MSFPQTKTIYHYAFLLTPDANKHYSKFLYTVVVITAWYALGSQDVLKPHTGLGILLYSKIAGQLIQWPLCEIITQYLVSGFWFNAYVCHDLNLCWAWPCKMLSGSWEMWSCSVIICILYVGPVIGMFTLWLDWFSLITDYKKTSRKKTICQVKPLFGKHFRVVKGQCQNHYLLRCVSWLLPSCRTDLDKHGKTPRTGMKKGALAWFKGTLSRGEAVIGGVGYDG